MGQSSDMIQESLVCKTDTKTTIVGNTVKRNTDSETETAAAALY